jgi:hypothetical protein
VLFDIKEFDFSLLHSRVVMNFCLNKLIKDSTAMKCVVVSRLFDMQFTHNFFESSSFLEYMHQFSSRLGILQSVP